MRVAALLTLLFLAPQAQTGASRLILAVVTDARGRAIVDVGADDFVVQEANVSRDVLSARVADYPIAVLLDTGSAARPDFGLMQRAALRFVERLGHDRPVAIGTFGETPRMLTTFDDTRETVISRLNEVTAHQGGSQLLGGAAVAAKMLHDTGALFSAIVVLSASTADSSGQTAEQLIAPIVDSDAILHVIGIRESSPGFRGGADRALRSLVEQTRGEFTPVYSATSYQAALDRLVERLGSEMLIEYLVPPGSKPVDAKIGIRLTGVRVRGLGVAPK